MAVITFVNFKKEETGKSMSLAAVATYMAIEHNVRTLVISTTNQPDRLKRCFWEEEKKSKLNFGIFGPNTTTILDSESGVKGLAKVIRSNKISPEIITNYTKVVFKERLEILLGNQGVDEKVNQEIQAGYPQVVLAAKQYYDRVFVDLDFNVAPEIREQIINQSDIVIVNLNQRLSSVEEFREGREKNAIYRSAKTLILVGRYDKYSKYNSKNISRYLGEKNQVLTLPYNTLFFEAAEEAGVPDLFLKFRKIKDVEDRNYFFIQEVKRISDNILYRLQEIQAGI